MLCMLVTLYMYAFLGMDVYDKIKIQKVLHCVSKPLNIYIMRNAHTECGQWKHDNMVDIVILTKFFFTEAIYEDKQEFREILHKT